jgi:hypothetical protein
MATSDMFHFGIANVSRSAEAPHARHQGSAALAAKRLVRRRSARTQVRDPTSVQPFVAAECSGMVLLGQLPIGRRHSGKSECLHPLKHGVLSVSTAPYSSLTVGPAPDFGVRGVADRFDRRARAIEPGFEDGVEGRVADRIDGKRPLARRFQPITLIAARQRDDAHGGAITRGRARITRSTRMAASRSSAFIAIRRRTFQSRRFRRRILRTRISGLRSPGSDISKLKRLDSAPRYDLNETFTRGAMSFYKNRKRLELLLQSLQILGAQGQFLSQARVHLSLFPILEVCRVFLHLWLQQFMFNCRFVEHACRRCAAA